MFFDCYQQNFAWSYEAPICYTHYRTTLLFSFQTVTNKPFSEMLIICTHGTFTPRGYVVLLHLGNVHSQEIVFLGTTADPTSEKTWKEVVEN